MAPASVASTGRGFPFSCPSTTQEGTPIMTDQPARVTPGRSAPCSTRPRRLTRGGGSLADQIAYHERKADSAVPGRR